MINTIIKYDPFNLFVEPIVFFNIETSGGEEILKNHNIKIKPEILEISAIKISRDLQGKEIIDEFTETVKNKNPIPKEVFDLCPGIAENHLKNSKDLKDVLIAFKIFIGDLNCIACYKEVVKDFLDYYYCKELNETFDNFILELSEFAMVMEPYFDGHILNALSEKVLCNHKTKNHTGLDKCKDSAKIMNALIYRYGKDRVKDNKIILDKEFDRLKDWEWIEILKAFKSTDIVVDYINEEIVREKVKKKRSDTSDNRPNRFDEFDILEEMEKLLNSNDETDENSTGFKGNNHFNKIYELDQFCEIDDSYDPDERHMINELEDPRAYLTERVWVTIFERGQKFRKMFKE